MDGKFAAFVQGDETCVVQNLARKFKEEAQMRLARIANGADPAFCNGNPKVSETKWVTGAEWDKKMKRTKKAQPV